MRLSRTIVYAIHAVLQLAESPGDVAISRSQLAAAGPLPERFLLEVLHALVAHGLVFSSRGVEGGFSLARRPEQITLRDIFEAFDFPRRPYVPTVEGQPLAIREQLLAALDQASNAALREFQKLTLAELQRNGSRKRVTTLEDLQNRNVTATAADSNA
jgi:Rrf2 family protein